MAKKSGSMIVKPEDTVPYPATRDHNFVRLSAYNGLAGFLGHDVILTLYSVEPEFRVLQTADTLKFGGGAFAAKQIEVANVRMAPEAAKIIAQNILTVLMQFELVEADELKSHIDRIAENLANRPTAESDHGG